MFQKQEGRTKKYPTFFCGTKSCAAGVLWWVGIGDRNVHTWCHPLIDSTSSWQSALECRYVLTSRHILILAYWRKNWSSDIVSDFDNGLSGNNSDNSTDFRQQFREHQANQGFVQHFKISTCRWNTYSSQHLPCHMYSSCYLFTHLITILHSISYRMINCMMYWST